MDVEQYIREIKKFRTQADAYSDNAPGAIMEKIRLLTAAHMLMGRVSAVRDGEYARIYAARKNAYAKARKEAPRGEKETAGDLAIENLRMLEADALEEKMMWKNEFSSLREYIYELRLRVRVDMNTLGGGD
ncbi:hypothetical protein [Paenibacillus wynnii]|uniref:Uncharacterized protein n=1 Tax=Paenibacillus wynnii TaxID=268407 RepID=A0A098M8V1_9BACL|nr:hypothetical protein [Paenibacillus wynnii]KGE18478.1 hypothetical protein PWYN_03155 [Paenibacillus wynnii]KGE20587.1 hypothetical protein PWYN_15465 [Paenibacillus wynnii]